MDTPSQESNAPLDTNQAASLFADIFSPESVKEQPVAKAAEAPDPNAQAEGEEAVETEKVEEAPDEGAQKVTIEVDGKTVELTPAQIAEAYKNGLRQEDYTKKTMATAEQRKAAEAEIAKAAQERMHYAQGLQQAQAVLQAQLQEQSQIDWQKLLESDPVEYLKQQHLANARQARLQQVHQEQQQLHARHQAEQAGQMRAYLQAQQEELLAKLPEWKDESKAQAEKASLVKYLKEQGLEDANIQNIQDHRVVLLTRKAMLYDQMMGKAQAAAKKVSQLPQRVERPGVGDTNQGLDKRTAEWNRFAKSGKVEDAAAIFSRIL